MHDQLPDDVNGEIIPELSVRPPLPSYFERLSSIGQADSSRVGAAGGKGEVFELAAMRGGRRGGIAVY